MRRTPLERRTPLRANKKLRNYGGVRRAIESKPHGDPKLAALGVRTLTNFPSEAEMILASKKRREKKNTKHARRERAPQSWWTFVKSQTCFVRTLLSLPFDKFIALPFSMRSVTYCSGGIEADHMGDRFKDGDGTRAHDRTSVPLCNGHHHERTNVRVAGTFMDFTKEDMREFCRLGIEWTHGQARALGVEIPNC